MEIKVRCWYGATQKFEIVIDMTMNEYLHFWIVPHFLNVIQVLLNVLMREKDEGSLEEMIVKIFLWEPLFCVGTEI